MIQRQRLPLRSSRGRARSAPPSPPVITIRLEQTAPVPAAPVAAARAADEEEPAILGFPAEPDPDEDAAGRPAGATRVEEDSGGPPTGALPQPVTDVHLVVVPRGEPWGGVALLVAGGAAAASLWPAWWRGAQVSGLHVVSQGLAVLGSGPGALGHSGLWPPVVVVLGGAADLLLGLVLLRRARSHRPAGLLALLVTLAAAVGVVVPLANADWSVHPFGPGMWCAVAVVLLGGLGALKAMLTPPRISAQVG